MLLLPLQLFAALRPGDRAVRRLVAADPPGRQALADFCQVGACHVGGWADRSHCHLYHSINIHFWRFHSLPYPSRALPSAQYLRSKVRVGVVALPALQQATAAAPVQRTLYLVPPSEEVCGRLGMDWQASTHCLLALVVLTPPQQAPPPPQQQ